MDSLDNSDSFSGGQSPRGDNIDVGPFQPMVVKELHEDEYSSLVTKPSWLRIRLESMVSSPWATVFNNPYTVTGITVAGISIVKGMVQSSTSASAIEMTIEVGSLVVLGTMLAGSVFIYHTDRYFTGEKMQLWKHRAQAQENKRGALKRLVQNFDELIEEIAEENKAKLRSIRKQMDEQLLFEVNSPAMRREYESTSDDDYDATGSANEHSSEDRGEVSSVDLAGEVKRKSDTSGFDIVNAETGTQTTTQTTTTTNHLTAGSSAKRAPGDGNTNGFLSISVYPRVRGIHDVTTGEHARLDTTNPQ